MKPLDQDQLITSEEALRALFPPTHEVAIQKSHDFIDDHTRAYIARSPFLCISTQSADGHADISPRGDPPGLVKVLVDKTLLIPDRPSNNRLDTLSNILSNPSVGMLIIVPGFDDTMRVNGVAKITTDPELLSMMQVQGRTPTVAIVVGVKEVFIHCAKAFRRSRLWDPTTLQDRKDLPSLLKIIQDQTTGGPEDADHLDKLETTLEDAYRTSMYWPPRFHGWRRASFRPL